jgi:hypothetical protein
MTTRNKALTNKQIDFAISELCRIREKAINKFINEKLSEKDYTNHPDVDVEPDQIIESLKNKNKITFTLIPDWKKVYEQGSRRYSFDISKLFKEFKPRPHSNTKELIKSLFSSEITNIEKQFSKAKQELYLGDQKAALELLQSLDN